MTEERSSNSAGEMRPSAWNRRRLSNQSTHLKVARSRSSVPRHEPRLRSSSVANSPMINSAGAVSYETSRERTDAPTLEHQSHRTLTESVGDPPGRRCTAMAPFPHGLYPARDARGASMSRWSSRSWVSQPSWPRGRPSPVPRTSARSIESTHAGCQRRRQRVTSAISELLRRGDTQLLTLTGPEASASERAQPQARSQPQWHTGLHQAPASTPGSDARWASSQ